MTKYIFQKEIKSLIDKFKLKLQEKTLQFCNHNKFKPISNNADVQDYVFIKELDELIATIALCVDRIINTDVKKELATKNKFLIVSKWQQMSSKGKYTKAAEECYDEIIIEANKMLEDRPTKDLTETTSKLYKTRKKVNKLYFNLAATLLKLMRQYYFLKNDLIKKDEALFSGYEENINKEETEDPEI